MTKLFKKLDCNIEKNVLLMCPKLVLIANHLT